MSIKKPLIVFSLFAVISILVTWVIWSTLQRGIDGDTRQYSATFDDVLGLKQGDDVRMAGVRVGRVDKIERTDDNRARIDISAGIVTSGAKGIDPPAAVGTIVPSSTTRIALTPRAM